MRSIVIVNDRKAKADYEAWPEMFGKKTTFHVSQIPDYIFKKNGKEARSSSFLMSAYNSARMVILSEHFYSYHHAMFIRRTNSVNLFYRRLIKFLLKKYGEELIEKFIRVLQIINFYKCMITVPRIHKDVKKILAGCDEIIFTGIMQTEYEHLLYIAAKKANKRLVYHPYNWDNPTSKTGFPQKYFDIIYPWGKQMYHSLVDVFPNVSKNFIGPPRFYGIKARPNLVLEKPNVVSFFGSQKDNPIIVKEVITSFAKLGFKLKIRPHPHSVMKVSFFRSIENVVLDQSVVPDTAESNMRICDIKKDSNFSKNINQEWIWENAHFIITPMSTSMLEAALRGIPSVVDLTNARQVTIAHARYFSHLSDFLIKDFVYNLYDLKQIESRDFLLKINFNSYDIVQSANFFCCLNPSNINV